LATSRESVSFHRPDKSVTADGSIRVTRLLKQPAGGEEKQCDGCKAAGWNRVRMGMVGSWECDRSRSSASAEIGHWD